MSCPQSLITDGMASHPEKWFDLSEADFENATSGTNPELWPFTNVSKSEFLYLLKHLRNTKAQAGEKGLQIYASLLGGIGSVFTILLIITLYRKAFTEKISFYKIMITISILDFVFCFLDTFYNAFYRGFKLYGSSSHGAMWLMLVFRGLVYSFSLASDMCTVALTLERYLAVTKPQLHKNLSEKRRVVQPFFGLAITILTSTRIHYSLEKTVQKRGSIYYYANSDLGATPFVIGLATFSDAVMPVLLLVSVTGLSILFLVSVIRRQKKKQAKHSEVKRTVHPVLPSSLGHPEGGTVAPNLPNLPAIAWPPKKDHKKHWKVGKDKLRQTRELKSMVTLTLALDALFLFNQLGYCVYLIFHQLEVHAEPISFDSTYDEISHWVLITRMATITDAFCVYCELLAHGLHFPLYLALSKSTRTEFLEVIKKMRARVKRFCNVIRCA